MVDILSIHIQKTGGTSFYNTLKAVYGTESIVRFLRRDYIKLKKQKIKLRDTIPIGVNVVHGHIFYEEAKELHEKNTKVIAWLRNPVERVISNYYFLMMRIKKNPDRHPQKHRINESLMQYVSRSEVRNKMSQYLNGIKLEDLYFFGFLESYHQDLKVLGEKLGWESIPEFHEKNNKESKQYISDNLVRKIAELNSKDVELYQHALKMRNK